MISLADTSNKLDMMVTLSINGLFLPDYHVETAVGFTFKILANSL